MFKCFLYQSLLQILQCECAFAFFPLLTAGVAEEHGALLVAVAVCAGGELVRGRLDQEAEQRVGGRHGVAVTQRGHLPAAAPRFVGGSFRGSQYISVLQL